MGIRTDPGYRLYTGNNFCFPTGKTPKKIYVTLSGILTGYYWMPEDGNPLNGTYVCETTDGQHWTTTAQGWTIDFGLLANTTILFVGSGGFPRMFYFYQESPCLFTGNNQNTSEWTSFYMGNFIAVPRE